MMLSVPVISSIVESCREENPSIRNAKRKDPPEDPQKRNPERKKFIESIQSSALTPLDAATPDFVVKLS
jgi:hypothetical protein